MNNKKTVRLAKMAMLVAISVVLAYFVHWPIIPGLNFLEYDPADISIFIGTFAFGPLGGFVLTVITSLIQGFTVSAGSGGVYGIIMHIIATGTFVLVAGNIYKKHKTRKYAMIALGAGIVSWVVVMFFANLVITPLFMSTTREVVMQMMPLILLFNLIKAGVNSIITFFLYKRISGFLHR